MMYMERGRVWGMFAALMAFVLGYQVGNMINATMTYAHSRRLASTEAPMSESVKAAQRVFQESGQ